MKPLIPLLQSSEDELERALLLSARADMPGRAGLQDTALALGLAAPTAKALADALAHALSANAAAAAGIQAAAVSANSLDTAATSAAGVKAAAASGSSVLGTSSAVASIGTASAATIVKCLVGGALLSFVSLTALNRALVPSTASPPAAAHRASAPNVRERSGPIRKAVRSALLAPAEASAEPVVEATPFVAPENASHRSVERRRGPALDRRAEHEVEVEPVIEPAPLAVPSVAAPPAPTAVPPPTNASLAAEIRLLDRTRAALGAGDNDGAQRLLRSYDASRPSGVLSQEADLLRVRLLLALGDRRAAANLARQIIVQRPESTHVDSLRSLAAEQ